MIKVIIKGPKGKDKKQVEQIIDNALTRSKLLKGRVIPLFPGDEYEIYPKNVTIKVMK